MSKKKMVLGELTILCWAAFTAILGRMRSLGGGLDAPIGKAFKLPELHATQAGADTRGQSDSSEHIAVRK